MKATHKFNLLGFFHNLGYFLREVFLNIKLNFLSHTLSILSTGLIFFIGIIIVSGWWISNEVVGAIENEAEINVYFKDDVKASNLVERIKMIEGIKEVKLVNEDEAYNRMEDVLGKEANVLEYFDDNIFSPFIEVKIHLEKMDIVLEDLEMFIDIEYIRDNKEVLEDIRNISGVLKVLGYVFLGAIIISTMIVISHIIRMGIYNNRDEINTLRLLGAPETFIGVPFILQGVLLTIIGGIFAALLGGFSIKYLYTHMTGPLPFIPLPPKEEIIRNVVILVTSLSALLGILGSTIGLKTAKDK